MFQNSTFLDLLIEFWEDQYYEHPIEAYRLPDGSVQFTDTGDKYIDKWEQELQDGKIPDLLEGFTPEQLKRIQVLRETGKTQFGHSAKAPTLMDTADSVRADALKQGLNDPANMPFPYNNRFKDIGIPEE